MFVVYSKQNDRLTRNTNPGATMLTDLTEARQLYLLYRQLPTGPQGSLSFRSHTTSLFPFLGGASSPSAVSALNKFHRNYL